MPKITVIPREIKENGYEQEPMGSVLCKILGVVGGGGGKQGAFIYVLNENGQWKDRQISL